MRGFKKYKQRTFESRDNTNYIVYWFFLELINKKDWVVFTICTLFLRYYIKAMILDGVQ